MSFWCNHEHTEFEYFDIVDSLDNNYLAINICYQMDAPDIKIEYKVVDIIHTIEKEMVIKYDFIDWGANYNDVLKKDLEDKIYKNILKQYSNIKFKINRISFFIFEI
jgi:hypothetical protein